MFNARERVLCLFGGGDQMVLLVDDAESSGAVGSEWRKAEARIYISLSLSVCLSVCYFLSFFLTISLSFSLIHTVSLSVSFFLSLYVFRFVFSFSVCLCRCLPSEFHQCADGLSFLV